MAKGLKAVADSMSDIALVNAICVQLSDEFNFFYDIVIILIFNHLICSYCLKLSRQPVLIVSQAVMTTTLNCVISCHDNHS